LVVDSLLNGVMRANSIHHLSIHAHDLEESVDFYTDLFEFEPIHTYDFDIPVQYLRMGDLQLHVFQRDVRPPEFHHFALNVDNFQEVYLTAKERGLFNEESKGSFYGEDITGTEAGSAVHLLPDDTIQMYLRDPAGNMIEIPCPDKSLVDREVIGELKDAVDVPQRGDAREATLFPESQYPYLYNIFKRDKLPIPPEAEAED
jgi:catechol 2,3-dioxygenase-like lactoylglutathione lyase family enzyme